MTPRERVLTAMNCEIPDRVPALLWGSYYTLNDETYFRLLEHLKIGRPAPPFRRYMNRNSNYYDDRILDRLGTDARYIWSGFTDLGGADMAGDRRDAWGVEWQRRGPNITSTGFPLSQATIEQIAQYPWPEPEKYLNIDFMKARLQALKRDYPELAIGARAVNSYGPFEQATELRGRVQFLMDTAVAPELARLLVYACTEVIVKAQEIYLDVVGQDIDFFEIPGDDFADNKKLMISPQTFKTLIKPALARIVSTVKDYRADLPVIFHSDGAIAQIIPDLIEIGIDVLNPLEPLPATDWASIKQQYAHKLCFMGGIDIRTVMNGPLAGVREEVRRCIDLFGEGGGYILAPANHLQIDVPPENIVALYEAVREDGQYARPA